MKIESVACIELKRFQILLFQTNRRNIQCIWNVTMNKEIQRLLKKLQKSREPSQPTMLNVPKT